MGWLDRVGEALVTGQPLQLNDVDWMSRRRVKAELLPADDLRRALISPPSGVNPRGLVIEGAQITGELDLDGADISFPVAFVACRFPKPVSAVGSRLRSLDFVGSRLLGLDLTQAAVGGNLGMVGTQLGVGVDNVALRLGLARIAGSWIATDGFKARGSIWAYGLHVDGLFALSGTLSGVSPRAALDLSYACLGNGWASPGLCTKGEVAARGVHVDGPLRFDGSSFQNPGGVALNIENADFEGGFFATDGFVTEGEILANGLRVAGQLNLDGASLNNSSDAPVLKGHADAKVVLRLEQATVTGTWFARNGFRTSGEMKIDRVSVGGQLDLSGASLSNPGGTAISLVQTRIGGDWVVGDEFSANGDVHFSGVDVDGHLDLEEATIVGELHLEEVSASRLILPDKPPTGDTSLGGCAVGALVTGETPPKLGAVAGLHMEDVYGPMRDDPSLAIRWLRRARWFIPQPWEELAKVYSRNGQPGHARRVRVAVARETTRHSGLWLKCGRMVHGATVGYGYHPLWSLGWIGAILVVVGLMAGGSPEAFVASSSATAAFNPWLFALATVGPSSVVVLPEWEPSAPGYLGLLLTLTALKAASWVLTALFLAGVTGLLRKDHV